MDRETLREEIVKYLYYCNHKGESLDWAQTREDIKRKYYSQTNHILALPLIARVLKALEDMEAGRLVRLAEDQSWPENPFELATQSHAAFALGVSASIQSGFRRVEAKKGEQE